PKRIASVARGSRDLGGLSGSGDADTDAAGVNLAGAGAAIAVVTAVANAFADTRHRTRAVALGLAARLAQRAVVRRRVALEALAVAVAGLASSGVAALVRHRVAPT